ncbi:hypothetical protein [Streptomyces sp. NPDC086787]|uniref:hypothetical protein n=1 Tax=Streptomyces sp. NPDC086787 TaxID=3365759 RepID=UPI00380692D0
MGDYSSGVGGRREPIDHAALRPLGAISVANLARLQDKAVKRHGGKEPGRWQVTT